MAYDVRAMEWYKEEKALYGSNGPVIAYDNYTGEHERTFESYEDFREWWPAAEITAYEMLEPGKGCIVYC